MGKRSRKRASENVTRRVERGAGTAAAPEAPATAERPDAPPAEPVVRAQPRPRSRARSGKPERPAAPWGNFPLVELCVLLALVLGVIGVFKFSDSRGPLLIGAAAALGSLAGLELSIREHFAGYKSHTTILAGTIAVASLAAMYFSRVGQGIMLAVAAAVFATGFIAFRGAFKRRAGVGFR
jgi:hypothetical protein